MTRHIRLALVLVLSLFLLSLKANSPVHIMSKDQLVTSTTLNWLPHSQYRDFHEIVIGGIEFVEKASVTTQTRIFVCRALHNGVWVAGGSKEGEKRCLVTFQNSVKYYNEYDLLEDTERATYVSWVDWSNEKEVPVGAVAPSGSKGYFIARHLVLGVKEDSFAQTRHIGTLSTKDGLGKITYIKGDGTEGSVERGRVLVELEPIRYDLNSVEVNINNIRVNKCISKTLGTATLKNTGKETRNITEVFKFSYNYSQYWGQDHAIKGLNTSVTLLNQTKLPNIVWGIPEQKLIDKSLTLFYLLQPGTAVNVNTVANYRDVNTSYTANLVAIYEDQMTKNRRIRGIRREETIGDLDTVFSPVFKIEGYNSTGQIFVPSLLTIAVSFCFGFHQNYLRNQ